LVDRIELSAAAPGINIATPNRSPVNLPPETEQPAGTLTFDKRPARDELRADAFQIGLAEPLTDLALNDRVSTERPRPECERNTITHR
jgi:hypothetical protein